MVLATSAGSPCTKNDQPTTSTRGSAEDRQVLAVETIVTHEGAHVRNTAWNAQLSEVNARVSAARTRPRCPQRMLTTSTKCVACLKW